MILNLTSRYRIVTEPLNYILQARKVNSKTRKHYWDTIGYFSRLKDLYTRCLKLEVLHSGLHDLKTLIERIDSFEAELSDALTKAGSVLLKYMPDNMVISKQGKVTFLKQKDKDENSKRNPGRGKAKVKVKKRSKRTAKTK